MEETQTRLRSMSFTPQGPDPCPAIQARDIVIWKTGLAAREGEESLPHVQTPGLVITPPKQVIAPPEAGSNERDDVTYPVLIQLVDRDGQEREKNLQSYLKWLEQIRRACNARSWPEVEIDLYGDVYQSFARVTDTVDPKLWKKMAGLFVAGVVVFFTVRETRGIEA